MPNGNYILTALGDRTRQTMLQRLRRRPMTVGELADKLPVTRPAVSQHLKILKQARLVGERREGTRHYFNLNAETLLDLRTFVDSLWKDAIASLARYIATQRRKRKHLDK